MATEIDPDRPGAQAGSPSRVVLIGAIAALALVLLVGVAIALTGGDDSDKPHQPAFGAVTVQGDALPLFEKGKPDPAVGTAAPVVGGVTPAGAPITIGTPGKATFIVFVAHWCPHCARELPILVDMARSGGFEGMRTVAVLTQTDEKAPNFPPVEWLDDKGWTGEVLLDDEAYIAAATFGANAYPFLVVLDATGTVVARMSGEMPAEEVARLVQSGRDG